MPVDVAERCRVSAGHGVKLASGRELFAGVGVVPATAEEPRAVGELRRPARSQRARSAKFSCTATLKPRSFAALAIASSTAGSTSPCAASPGVRSMAPEYAALSPITPFSVIARAAAFGHRQVNAGSARVVGTWVNGVGIYESHDP